MACCGDSGPETRRFRGREFLLSLDTIIPQKKESASGKVNFSGLILTQQAEGGFFYEEKDGIRLL